MVTRVALFIGAVVLSVVVVVTSRVDWLSGENERVRNHPAEMQKRALAANESATAASAKAAAASAVAAAKAAASAASRK